MLSNLIEWERMGAAGVIPAAVLQRHLGGPIATWLIDPLSNLLYLSHFVTPVVIGLVLWKRKQRLYWEFVAGFLFLSFLGFATYILFPAAPPWWASERGYLGGLEQVGLDRFLLAGVTANQAPNPVAAVPSLHCAYPLYFFSHSAAFCWASALGGYFYSPSASSFPLYTWDTIT